MGSIAADHQSRANHASRNFIINRSSRRWAMKMPGRIGVRTRQKEFRREQTHGLGIKERYPLSGADFCDACRVCRETAYQQIRGGRLRAVKLGRKTLILRADAEVWAASLPELRTGGREQASA
jgi:hypothetical protein